MSMKRVLFICSGNTCRSPMAMALLRSKVTGDEFDIRSAGLRTMQGFDASENALQVLRERGIELEHVTQTFDDVLGRWADVILTMTRAHREQIRDTYPDLADRTFTLYEFVTGLERDINDPFGGSMNVYRQVRNELEPLVNRLVLKLTNDGSKVTKPPRRLPKKTGE
ncbi:low molecular weight protein arginine phosphatase [Exiguobacterium sp. SH31]|uniref:low molecular weight protein arginine phosphatase n=1 Tax=Exiguobacterium sp. SH31 TaxID=1843183 RepID=UPI0009FFBFC3|nr:low molecular weight protein arginine phosphatase [Exiguobacterium sp. SH31]